MEILENVVGNRGNSILPTFCLTFLKHCGPKELWGLQEMDGNNEGDWSYTFPMLK